MLAGRQRRPTALPCSATCGAATRNPDSRNRWDKPLFRLDAEKTEDSSAVLQVELLEYPLWHCLKSDHPSKRLTSREVLSICLEHLCGLMISCSSHCIAARDLV